MFIVKPLLGLFFKDVVQDAAKRAAEHSINELAREQIRREFLRTVAEGYTREVEHNLSQYVRSLGAMSVTIEPTADMDGDRLFSALQSSLKTLEAEIETLGPESAIVRYLRDKYNPEPDLLVGRQPVSMADMLAGADRRQQIWLNRSGTVELPESISAEVARLLDSILQDELSP
jgi:hypothetical protein